MKTLFVICCLFILPFVASISLIRSGQYEIYHSSLNDTNKTFYVALKHNPIKIQKLEKLILEHISNPNSPYYGNYLTISQINKYVESDHTIRQKVMRYFRDNNILCHDYSDALKCNGRTNDLNRIFNVTLGRVFDKERMKYTNLILSDTNYITPLEISRFVDFIDGISNPIYLLNHYKPKMNVKASSRVDPNSVSREVLMRMYNLYPAYSGKNVSVGAIEFQAMDGFSNKHLVLGQMENGVPANPITKNHIIGTEEAPDVESELDVQVMYWASSDAELWYEVAPAWMYSWAMDFMHRKEIPEVISLSWGWSELDQCNLIACINETSKQYVERTNVEFMKIVARGTTIVVASGDAGSPGRTNEMCMSWKGDWGWNHINAVFPGGSPWVLSVAGTYLVAGDAKFNYTTPVCTTNQYVKCANGMSEEVTTWSQTSWTSGAGFTHWDKTPDWQKKEVQNYLSTVPVKPDAKYFNSDGRAYPDVSAFGHNCPIKLPVGWDNVDGTSCASPIFAGVITNLNSFQKSRGRPVLGFVNPLLYKMKRTDWMTFNDITVGFSGCTEEECCSDQFGFHASPGWDAVSGLGTPNVERMKYYLSNTT